MKEIFGERLKKAREEKGWTQEHLASLLGISNGAISGYERGYREPDLDMLTKLANILGVSSSYLLGETISKLPIKSPKVAEAKEKYDGQEIIAAHKAGDLLADLPPKARESVEEYIDFVRKKHRIE